MRDTGVAKGARRRSRSPGGLVPLLVLGLAATALSLAPRAAAGQTDTQRAAPDTMYRVVLVDGSTVVGRIVASDAALIVVVTSTGARFEIERTQIRSMAPMTGRVVNGEVWPEDANHTRLFFGPTARSLGHGNGYAGLYELFFSFIGVGVGERVTLAGGTPIFPGTIGEVFYLAPKLTVINEARVQVAAGALAFFATREIDEGSVGIVYGVSTFGDRDDAVTLGAGWGFALGDEDASLGDEPVFMVGLERRIRRGIKVISENYFADGGGLVSGGIRALGARFSADMGLGAALFGDDASCCLPIVTVAYRF